MEGVAHPLPEVTELRSTQEASNWVKAEDWGDEVGLRLAGGHSEERGPILAVGCRCGVWLSPLWGRRRRLRGGLTQWAWAKPAAVGKWFLGCTVSSCW